MEIADKIRDNLKLYNMSESELARRIGADQTLVARWLMGVHIPTRYYIVKISKVFNCSVPYLLGRYD